MSRLALILATLLLSATVAPGAGRPAPGPKPAGTDGAYQITARGYYHGEGTANVSANTISLAADLTGENGEKGQLSAPNLVISGNYVSGTGTIMGQSVTVYGRLDPTGQGDGKKLKTARFVAVIAAADGHYVRIQGLLQPVTPAAPSTGDSGNSDSASAGSGDNSGAGRDHQHDHGHIVDDDDNGPSADELN